MDRSAVILGRIGTPPEGWGPYGLNWETEGRWQVLLMAHEHCLCVSTVRTSRGETLHFISVLSILSLVLHEVPLHENQLQPPKQLFVSLLLSQCRRLGFFFKRGSLKGKF